MLKARIESTSASNDWGEMWREAIDRDVQTGLAGARPRVQFGGKNRAEIDIFAREVCVLPARAGHRCVSARPDIGVIGTYPPRGKSDRCRGSTAERVGAIAAVAEVPMRQTDPVFGRPGPLTRLRRS